MKTNKILAIALVAMVAGVTLTSCGGSKAVSRQSDLDRQMEMEKKKMELEKVRAEAEMQRKKTAMELEDYDNQLAQKRQDQAQLVKGEQRTLIYCMKEAFDKPGETMGGLGVVEDRPDRNRAIVDANRAAIADIASRYIGMIKNAIEDYSKDVNVPAGKKMYESSLEGGAKTIGTKVVDKYANVVCREVAQSATGAWVGYVAVQVMLKDAMKGLADELEVRKVDYDKKKFFEKMDAEIEADAAKRQAELASGSY
jgi:type II secretory pathway pseudopilin PulG